jgi:precorrin-8X/cobalt-precorrin-8 methylmutase
MVTGAPIPDAGDGDEAYRIVRSRIDLSRLAPLSRCVTERVIMASADFDYATDLVCDEQVLAAGVEELAAGVPVVADGVTVAAGIWPGDLHGEDSLTARLARTAAISRPAAAVGWPSARPGRARSGWWLRRRGGSGDHRPDVQPALVIALPVGLVGAAEARTPSEPARLTSVSEKGGGGAAAFSAWPSRAGRGRG